MRGTRRSLPATLVLLLGLAAAGLGARADVPTARLVSAPRLVLPGRIDSNNPLVWHHDGSRAVLTAFTSFGGEPMIDRGASLEGLSLDGPVVVENHPGDGVWLEAVVPDDAGVWYGYYHHERPATECGRPDRQLPRIGALRSADQGRTWTNLGVLLDAPPGSAACDSTGRFVLGGVGDVSAALDADRAYLYVFFSQYERDPAVQGVAVARYPWAARDAPQGAVAVWNDGAWLPSTAIPSDDDDAPPAWSTPIGSPLVRATKPFHDGQNAADVFWGPAVHWNTYLERWVMLLNRADNEQFGQNGIYVAFAATLDDPAAWSTPAKIRNGGGWYPQAVGLENGVGTDRIAGERARFFQTGVSTQYIEFRR